MRQQGITTSNEPKWVSALFHAGLMCICLCPLVIGTVPAYISFVGSFPTGCCLIDSYLSNTISPVAYSLHISRVMLSLNPSPEDRIAGPTAPTQLLLGAVSFHHHPTPYHRARCKQSYSMRSISLERTQAVAYGVGMKTNERKDWQANPETIKAEYDGRIQWWNDNGTMMTAQMSLARARELVATGSAFCISDAAVGQCAN